MAETRTPPPDAKAAMPKPRVLNFITGNEHKLFEVRQILESSTGVELRSQNLDLPEMQGTIEQISKDKCVRAAELMGGPVLVEDTCLCFKAWNELPGPYIKWFVKELGPDGMYKLLEGFEDKSAIAICTFAYSAGPGHEPLLFQGRMLGKVVPARGPRYFGWDSAFEYEGQTYAEMDKAVKNKVSHRGRALAKLQEWLSSAD